MTQEPADLKSRIKREGMQKSIDRAFDVWWTAPTHEKPGLLLTGPLLAWGERWLMMHPDEVSVATKNFILRSLADQSRKYALEREKSDETQGQKDARYKRLIIAMAVLALMLLMPTLMRDISGLLDGPDLEIVATGPVIARPVTGPTTPAQLPETSRNEAGDAGGAAQVPVRLPDGARPKPDGDAGPDPQQQLAHLARLVRSEALKGDRRTSYLLALEYVTNASALKPEQMTSDTMVAASSDVIDALVSKLPLKVDGGDLMAHDQRAILCRSSKRIVAATDGRAVRVWDPSTGGSQVTPAALAVPIRSSAFDRDCLRWLDVSRDYEVALQSFGEAGPRLKLGAHETDIVSTAFSADGRVVATLSRDSVGKVWDTRTGRRLAELTSDDVTLTAIALSADGRLAATATEEHVVQLWDIASRRPVGRLDGHTGVVTKMLFGPDGQHIMTLSQDGTARFWDVRTGSKLFSLRPPSGSVVDAKLSADGSRTAILTDTGLLQVWNNASQTVEAGFATDEKVSKDFVLSEDGRFAAVADWSGAITVWLGSSRLGRPIGLELNKAGPAVASIGFSPDGSHLQAVALTGAVLQWPLFVSAESGLVHVAREARQCLDSEERQRLGVPVAVPRWCSGLR